MIEIVRKQLMAKLNLVEQIVECIKPYISQAQSIQLVYWLNNLYNIINFATCIIFSTQWASVNEAKQEYCRILATEGLITELDRLVDHVQLFVGINYKPPWCGRKRIPHWTPQINVPIMLRNLFVRYMDQRVDITLQAIDSDIIDNEPMCTNCHIIMTIIDNISEVSCPRCAKIADHDGPYIDDMQSPIQDNKKTKSGSFSPTRHFRFWMTHIMGQEPEEELGDKMDEDNMLGEKLLPQLTAIIKRDNKILQLLTVADVRAMLKECHRTDLNKNVPLIMRLLTGVGPPILPEAICQHVEKLFSRAIEVGERLRISNRKNRNYYPYYLYKILDAVLTDDVSLFFRSLARAEKQHMRTILKYIYRQGRSTIAKNDLEWQTICQSLPDIKWVASVG